ncbi:MAG: N-acetyltransferase [Gammaproteobacteria bacterium]|nr:N-acetyltransferase [Gammaproteobacteria bacterium]
MNDIEIREEEKKDIPDIRKVTALAFKDKPYADGDEQDVIDRLRDAKALSLSLVAIENGNVVGQITFSPTKNSDGSIPWFGLGPVSVLPSHQGLGIGAYLINTGLKRIRDFGALGCILTGNPDYYKKFGFVLSPDNAPKEEPIEYFMINLFNEVKTDGIFSFHEAFYGTT